MAEICLFAIPGDRENTRIALAKRSRWQGQQLLCADIADKPLLARDFARLPCALSDALRHSNRARVTNRW